MRLAAERLFISDCIVPLLPSSCTSPCFFCGVVDKSETGEAMIFPLSLIWSPASSPWMPACCTLGRDSLPHFPFSARKHVFPLSQNHQAPPHIQEGWLSSGLSGGNAHKIQSGICFTHTHLFQIKVHTHGPTPLSPTLPAPLPTTPMILYLL